MKVVADSGSVADDQITAVVITGDGKTEFRVLKALAQRCENDGVLWFPQQPLRYLSVRGRTQGKTTSERMGLDALDSLELYKTKYGITSFLYLVDREHIDGSAVEELEAKLNTVASTDNAQITHREAGAYDCSCQIGSREVTVYTAILGDNFGFIEDCLADLLNFVWNNSIEAEDKEEFKNRVDQAVMGGVYQDLINDGDVDDLRRAFPSICSALESMV